MSTASFEALSWPGDRTNQGSKFIHQISTRNLYDKLEHCVATRFFFFHNRWASLQIISGRLCPWHHCKYQSPGKPFLVQNSFISSSLKMNSTMPTFHFYALVTHGLGFSIPLSYMYDVKDKNVFLVCANHYCKNERARVKQSFRVTWKLVLMPIFYISTEPESHLTPLGTPCAVVNTWSECDRFQKKVFYMLCWWRNNHIRKTMETEAYLPDSDF